jgi:hypothetical protein
MVTAMELDDYVVATKYRDGDPGDQFCVGFYNGSFTVIGRTRHLVKDSSGQNFRNNGFRRCEPVSHERGSWIVEHIPVIERYRDSYSVWDWVNAPWGAWLG